MEPSNRHAQDTREGGRASVVFGLSGSIGLLVVVFLSAYPENSATQIFKWPGPLFYPLLLLVLVIWIVGAFYFSPEVRLPGNGWSLGIAGLAVGVVCSSVFGTSYPVNILGVSPMILGILVFLAIYQGAARGGIGLRGLAEGISVVGALITFVSLYRWALSDVPTALGLMDPLNQRVGEDLLQFSFAENRNPHPFGHQNYTAGAMLLFIPWHLRSVLYACRRMKLLWGIVVVLDLVCLVSTFSRGAMLGLAGGGVACLFWFGKKGALSKKALIWTGIGLAVIGAVLLVANPRMRSSIARLATQGSTQVDQVRSNMAEAGWIMFKNHWLVGVGPGNVTTAYPRYRSQIAAGLEDNYQLHIAPLQIAVEQGLVGVAAWAVIVFASLRSFHRRANDEQSIATTAFFCLLTYGIFSFTDYQLDVLPIVILVFANLGLLAASDVPVRTFRAPMRGVLGFGVVVVSLLVLMLMVFELRARWVFDSAMTALRAGDADKFEAQTIRAAEIAPASEYFLNQLADYHAQQRAGSTNEVLRADHLASAQRWLKASLRKNPDQEFCYFNLGWMLQDSDPLQSAGCFVEAARLVPDRKGVFRGLALSLMNLGRTNLAIQTLALECLVNPAFVAGAFWSHEGHGDLWPDVYSSLKLDLQNATSEFPVGDPGRRVLERRAAVLDWRETGRLEEVKKLEWPTSWKEFWDSVRSSDRSSIRSTPPKVAWKYLHDAWANETERESLVAKAVILSTQQIPDDAVVAELVRWISQDKWSDVVRRVPPPELFRVYGRQRSGFNLLARNVDGIKPTDVCAYVDNHVVELFFEFLYGRKDQVSSLFILKRLDEIVDEFPELKDAVVRIRVSAENP